MSLLIKACCGAYEDDKREALNSLIRVKTPFPKRSDCDELAVKTASCVCIPLKCLESVGMMVCGAILWPIPCTVCKIETIHEGTQVSVKKIYLDCRSPNIPCHFDDIYYSKDSITRYEGTSIPCSCCSQRFEGKQEEVYATSSVTGYGCISSGVGKVVSTLLSSVCIPISCMFLACGNKEDSSNSTSGK